MGKLLRTLGILIAVASVGLGLYIQIDLGSIVPRASSIRAEYALSAIAAMTGGLLLAGLGHLLVLREAESN